MRPPKLLLVLPVIVALASAGCSETPEGSGIASLGDADAPAETERAEVDPEEAMLAFADCMREQGVPMGGPEAAAGFAARASDVGDYGDDADEADEADPSDRSSPEVVVNGEPIDGEVFAAAEEACQEHLDGVIGDHELDPAQQAEMEDQMLAFAACMREQGVDWPDPVFAGSPPDEAAEARVDADDPAVHAAMEVCADEGVVVNGEARASIAGSGPTGEGGDRGDR